jgi:hypothetical protein
MHEPLPTGVASPVTTDSPGGATSGNPLAADPHALQILSTEHWSLLATRSLVYNEAFTRAAMFLAFVSATVVALGIVSTATGFSRELGYLAVVLLGTTLFIGLATLGRVLDAGAEDLVTIAGMNRIRHAYRTVSPTVAPYFVSGFHDDPASVLASYGVRTPEIHGSMLHLFTTAPALIGVICSVLAGSLASIIVLLAGGSSGIALLGAIGTALAMFALGVFFGYRHAAKAEQARTVLFPAPTHGGSGRPPERSRA